MLSRPILYVIISPSVTATVNLPHQHRPPSVSSPSFTSDCRIYRVCDRSNMMVGLCCEAENFRGEGMGSQVPEADLFWYVLACLLRRSFESVLVLTSRVQARSSRTKTRSRPTRLRRRVSLFAWSTRYIFDGHMFPAEQGVLTIHCSLRLPQQPLLVLLPRHQHARQLQPPPPQPRLLRLSPHLSPPARLLSQRRRVPPLPLKAQVAIIPWPWALSELV